MNSGFGEHAVVWNVVRWERGGWRKSHEDVHSNSDFLRGGVLPAMMMSFALPDLRLLSVDL